MTIFKKTALSGRFGKPVYIISGILTLAMSAVVFFHPMAIPVCLLVKIFSVPVIFYLYFQLSGDQGMYFYLNLGISRKEYFIIPFVVEFLVFVLLMILSANLGHVIR